MCDQIDEKVAVTSSIYIWLASLYCVMWVINIILHVTDAYQMKCSLSIMLSWIQIPVFVEIIMNYPKAKDMLANSSLM